MTTNKTHIEVFSVKYEKALIDEGIYNMRFAVREYPDRKEETMYELWKDIQKLLVEKYQTKEVEGNHGEAV